MVDLINAAYCVMSLSEYKKCDLCGFSTKTTLDDLVVFGDWMHSHGITVHYFCLLLSTNLPQNGKDWGGILGFLTRDIRLEIQNALLKRCFYCRMKKASIACHKCKKYFHLSCGQQHDCAFQFFGEFRSYCHKCIPLDNFQLKTMKHPPPNGSEYCYICKAVMSNYSPINWIYANCCGNGFAHRLCIRKYALSAGYYLACIWCRSKQFRDHVRMQGVFVPDRDAQWEREKNAYAELHRGHKRCDMEVCYCPKGRNYATPRWKIIVCSLCGSFGAHTPKCISGNEKQKQKIDDFKCDTCRNIEESVSNDQQQRQQVQVDHDYGCEMDYTLHVNKMPSEAAAQPINETPLFSDDETDTSSISTATTVLRHVSNINSNIAISKPTARKEIKENTQQRQIVATQTLNADAQHTTASTSRDISNDDVQNWVNIKGWPDFDSDWKCIGSCTLHINLNSPRFAGKTIEDICADPLDSLITDADKVERTPDKGIFKVIDEVIEEFIEENKDIFIEENREIN